VTGPAGRAAAAGRGGPAALSRMLAAQTAMELRLTLRRGESVLLTLVIPVVLLTLFAEVHVLSLGRHPVDFLVPGVLALAVMSTAFTGQAIATGYERQYGVLKRLGASPLPRWALLAAKTCGVLAVELLQAGVLLALGVGLGWAPHGSPATVVGLLVVGTAAFSGLGLLLAGTLRAEATLAAANLIYLVFLVLGGVVFPVSRLPVGIRPAVRALPVSALSGGLRAQLRYGAAVSGHDWLVLVCWAVAALLAAAVTFRWE
jgi:ABC-2 type transport system permease protein